MKKMVNKIKTTTETAQIEPATIALVGPVLMHPLNSHLISKYSLASLFPKSFSRKIWIDSAFSAIFFNIKLLCPFIFAIMILSFNLKLKSIIELHTYINRFIFIIFPIIR